MQAQAETDVRNAAYARHPQTRRLQRLYPRAARKYIVAQGNIEPAKAAISACSGLTAYSAIKKLPQLCEDDSVVVVGAGGVGLAAINLLVQLTKVKVVVLDLSEAKRSAALAIGATHAIDPKVTDAVDQIKAACNGTARAVLDFVGTNTTVELGLQLIGRGGQIIVIGLFGGEITVSVSTLAMRNIKIEGSNVGTLEELQELVALMNSRNIRDIPVASRPMDEVNYVLEDLESGRTIGRTVLVPAS